MGRRLFCSTLVVALLLSFGCSSAPRPIKRLAAFGENSKDKSLRKQVEADSFPSAKQAGVPPAQ
jgi:hypothetical protein